MANKNVYKDLLILTNEFINIANKNASGARIQKLKPNISIDDYALPVAKMTLSLLKDEDIKLPDTERCITLTDGSIVHIIKYNKFSGIVNRLTRYGVANYYVFIREQFDEDNISESILIEMLNDVFLTILDFTREPVQHFWVDNLLLTDYVPYIYTYGFLVSAFKMNDHVLNTFLKENLKVDEKIDEYKDLLERLFSTRDLNDVTNLLISGEIVTFLKR